MFQYLIILLIVAAMSFFYYSYTTADNITQNTFKEVFSFLYRIIFIVIFPLFYLLAVDQPINDCCSDTAGFSPEHKLTIYALIGLSVISYFTSFYRKRIFPPIPEVILNSLLIIGFILSILIAIHTWKELFVFSVVFCYPIASLFFMALRTNHRILLKYTEDTDFHPNNKCEQFAWRVLNSDNKFLYLFILCFPILFLIIIILILFGQKPDSVIRVFTDTYKHTFSQLDYECDNVECGGHFLCSVAANGHKEVVKPVRYGERLGGIIICNRQLLVANAFEELLWRKSPKVHNYIRTRYNRVGDMVHKYYYVFDNKFVADFIYMLMKPLELVFWITLYTFECNPENRIAKQYLKREDRYVIEKIGLK